MKHSACFEGVRITILTVSYVVCVLKIPGKVEPVGIPSFCCAYVVDIE